jgi:membrane peptidoglycan carboxypeptidase
VRKLPSEKLPSVFKKPDTYAKIVNMMEAVTEEGGTATKASVPGFKVAGKTGTSQKWVNGSYSGTQFFATFIGFVPADKPAFVLMVTADEPKGSHFGGAVGGPCFSGIAERTLKYMNIPPELPIPENTKLASKDKGKSSAKPVASETQPRPAAVKSAPKAEKNRAADYKRYQTRKAQVASRRD